MKLESQLQQVEESLKTAGIATARLDALILLEIELKKDRTWILAHLDDQMPKLSKKFAQGLARRVSHEPLAYIISKSEFYGREFAINNHTLVPRPETETMIDLAKKHIKSPVHMVDVGCGSGVIGITAHQEKLTNKLTLIDIDSSCLKIAADNARVYGVEAKILKSDLLNKFKPENKITVLMANLPYVPASHTVNKAAMHEPKHAIFGGVDGLDLYRTLFKQIASLDQDPVLVFTESLPFQHEELIRIAKNAGYKQVDEEDFIQVFTARP